jgi:hypothetical protein
VIDDQLAKNLVYRFAGLLKYPRNGVAVAELAKAMMLAPSEKRAEGFVNRWLRDHKESPKPMDIYGAFQEPSQVSPEFRPYGSGPPPPPKCGHCGDSGWITFEKGGYSFAKRCHHPSTPPPEPPELAGDDTPTIAELEKRIHELAKRKMMPSAKSFPVDEKRYERARREALEGARLLEERWKQRERDRHKQDEGDGKR